MKSLLNVLYLFFGMFVIQSTLPMFLLQLVLLKAVLALRKSVNKLRSRDITELMMLCSVSQQWRSAFSITMRHRLKALLRCEFIYTVDIALSVVKRLGVYAGYRCGNKCAHFCISLVVTFVSYWWSVVSKDLVVQYGTVRDYVAVRDELPAERTYA